MPIVIGGLQGTGNTTFADRAREYGVTDFNIHTEFARYRSGYKRNFAKVSGPFVYDQGIMDEFAESYPFVYEETSKEGKDLWYNTPIELLEWICDNTNETTVLITVPDEIWYQRLFEREKTRDHRLANKSNAFELVKYEYEKLLNSRAETLARLEDKVDYHIVNNGELGQYHAVIDNILNEHNLLN